ncbi:hypothetical protein FPCIR_14141 [Fusarium pseudocircinatum]|uniref:Uncharacterized protein n=1 Tax=Fusarium pseudocircinatum TaxID=56676 RepID=A0A8H5KI92_9HYPO|nr:hypothetical protein FPCIR_14141 [Fusarium pseudocircinatum]
MGSFLADQIASSESSTDLAEGGDRKQASASVFITGNDSATSDKPENPESTPNPVLSFNQATPTGLILNWPSIRKLIEHHIRREGIRYHGDFSINHERDGDEYSHPVMRFRDRFDYHHLEACSPPSANSGDQSWNHIFPKQAHHKRNVLSWDGSCDFSELKVWAYVQSFKDNILNLHPIVETKVVDGWVQQFLDTLLVSDVRSAKPQLSDLWEIATIDSRTPKTTSKKRKRSLDTQSSAGRPDRSINSALVLTILALGKFCYYHSSILNVAYQKKPCPDSSPATHDSAVYLQSNRELSPGLSTPSSIAHPLLSGESQDMKAQSQSSLSHDEDIFSFDHHLGKKLEDKQGLEYFAQATDIVGNHVGSYNNIKNVYVNVFASLYHDQLDRPIESLAFILDASHKLQVIMRPSLSRMREIKRNSELIQESRYNNLALAFWTCLQLESIHRILHASQGLKKADGDVLKKVDLVSHDVSGMHWVPPSFTFREDDPPADDVLAARLRAGYWSTQILLYRPFLKQILYSSQSISNHTQTPTSNITDYEDTATYSVSHIARKHDETSPQILELARKGIKALIEGCRAFHGLGDKRPIITNVFGTAHT